MNRWLLILLLALSLYSCTNIEFGEVNTLDNSPSSFHNGAFVINEGLFNSGGGDVSWIDFSNGTISNEIFRSVNGFPPGDIPFHAALSGDNIFLTINNSAKVYIINDDFEVVKIIEGIASPREICAGSGNTMFVSSLYKPYIYVIDAEQGILSDSIYTERPVENLLLHAGKLWATHWSKLVSTQTNNALLVIDTTSMQLEDSVIIGVEPNSMGVDVNGFIWVLCSGGFDHTEVAKLVVIDPLSNSIIRNIPFASLSDYPSAMVMNAARDSVYFINQHIYKMAVSETSTPTASFIQSSGNTFYRLAVNPADNSLWVSDAGDYVHAGQVLHYSSSGNLLQTFNAGVVPGYVVFRE